MPTKSNMFSGPAKFSKAGEKVTLHVEGTEKKAKPEPVKSVEIRIVDNGGYIVSYYKPEPGPSMGGGRVEKTYSDIEGVMGCIEETLGKVPGKKEKAEYEEESGED